MGKAAEFLDKYQTEQTDKMAGEVIQAVRALMNDAVNVTRCAFSRVFIYGVCFVGIHLHFQVTYANILCASGKRSDECQRAKSLWIGIFAAFVSMGLVLAKVIAITKFLVIVWSVVWRYNSALSSEHVRLVRYADMQGQISRAKWKLRLWTTLLVPSCFSTTWCGSLPSGILRRSLAPATCGTFLPHWTCLAAASICLPQQARRIGRRKTYLYYKIPMAARVRPTHTVHTSYSVRFSKRRGQIAPAT